MEVKSRGSEELQATEILQQGFLWAPIRFLISLVLTVGVAYSFYGHDAFMFQVLGYESEACIEGSVQGMSIENATVPDFFSLTTNYDSAYSKLSGLAPERAPTSIFDVFKSDSPSHKHSREILEKREKSDFALGNR